MRAPFNDPIFDDFKDQLEELHILAETHPGFVWRYKGEDDVDGYIKPYPNAPLIMANLSAWVDYQSLFSYTFSGRHLEIMKSKRKWFSRLTSPHNVIYYGERNDLAKPGVELLNTAKRRLNYLRVYGDTPIAFGFGSGIEAS